MDIAISVFFLLLTLVLVFALSFVLFTLCRFLFLEYVNAWRINQGKKPYSRSFVMFVSILFALAFII